MDLILIKQLAKCQTKKHHLLSGVLAFLPSPSLLANQMTPGILFPVDLIIILFEVGTYKVRKVIHPCQITSILKTLLLGMSSHGDK